MTMKKYFLAHRISCHSAGIALACRHIRKKRCRNGSQLISIFCAKSHLCHLRRSIRRQGRKRFWALPVITALFFLAGAWWFF